MRNALAIAAIFALSACGGAANDTSNTGDETAVAEVDPSNDAGFEAVAPGEYEVVHSDGRIDHLTVHPGLTWSMVYANNEIAGGTIFAQDGKNCFVTEGVEGHQCFAGSPPDENGAIEVTGDDGEVATVRPVTG